MFERKNLLAGVFVALLSLNLCGSSAEAGTSAEKEEARMWEGFRDRVTCTVDESVAAEYKVKETVVVNQVMVPVVGTYPFLFIWDDWYHWHHHHHVWHRHPVYRPHIDRPPVHRPPRPHMVKPAPRPHKPAIMKPAPRPGRPAPAPRPQVKSAPPRSRGDEMIWQDRAPRGGGRQHSGARPGGRAPRRGRQGEDNMKSLHKIFLTAMLCLVSSVASAYNPALEDDGRWVFYDSDKEGVMRFDKESITLEGDRYAYVWAKKVYNKPELLGKEDLQLMCVDCEKKKYKILDYIFYSDKETVATSARYNALTGVAAKSWEDKNIEKKANKELIKLIFDKNQKELLVEEDDTKMSVPDDCTEMGDYINSLSTNQWQYIGGRNLVDEATGLGESYVFYYDKQNVEVSKDGNKITAWIKYRYLDGKNPAKKPLVQYGLSQTTINFANNTYVDHVMLAYDEKGKRIAEYDEETGVERKIKTGTIMAMIADALN